MFRAAVSKQFWGALINFDLGCISSQGGVWEELVSRLVEVQMDQSDDSSVHDRPIKTVNFVTVETDELGMFALVLCPRQDVKHVKSDGIKVQAMRSYLEKEQLVHSAADVESRFNTTPTIYFTVAM